MKKLSFFKNNTPAKKVELKLLTDSGEKPYRINSEGGSCV